VDSGVGGIAVADSRGMDWVVKRSGLRKKRSAKKSTAKKKTTKDRAEEKSAKLRRKIEATIRAIPLGKVSTYGGIARIAGFSGASRLVARVLRRSHGFGLPWQRVLGAGGEIKLRGDSAIEQKFRLQSEGVKFRGRKVDMRVHEWKSGKKR
jgi:methylated-DNA-protein-cysteine methyltransferase-like protein